MSNNVFQNYPQENCYDLSAKCQGKITKDLFIQSVKHFAKKEIPVYGIYCSLSRKEDIVNWINSEEKFTTDIVSFEEQKKICNEYNVYTQKINIENIQQFWCPRWCPPLIFEELDEQQDGIYCFVAGANHYKKYKETYDKFPENLIKFKDIEKEFGKENIIVIKIG